MKQILLKLETLRARADQFSDRGEVLSLSKLEQRIKLELDSSHRLILEEYGYSVGFDVAVYFPKGKDKFYIDTIFGMNSKKYSLIKAVEAYCYRIGNNMVPFASACHGDLVVYNKSTKQVFWWDHEAPYEEDDFLSFNKLSDGIPDFILNLTIDTQDKIDPEGSTEGLVSVNLDF